MRIDNIKRLIVEDFDDKDQELISKVAQILNPFMEQVYNALNKGIDFDNLTQEVISIRITVDSTGTPNKPTKFATKILKYSYGAICINAKNLSDNVNYPNDAIFISFIPDTSQNLFQIQKVFGLLPNKQYEITAIVIGKSL